MNRTYLIAGLACFIAAVSGLYTETTAANELPRSSPWSPTLRPTTASPNTYWPTPAIPSRWFAAARGDRAAEIEVRRREALTLLDQARSPVESELDSGGPTRQLLASVSAALAGSR